MGLSSRVAAFSPFSLFPRVYGASGQRARFLYSPFPPFCDFLPRAPHSPPKTPDSARHGTTLPCPPRTYSRSPPEQASRFRITFFLHVTPKNERTDRCRGQYVGFKFRALTARRIGFWPYLPFPVRPLGSGWLWALAVCWRPTNGLKAGSGSIRARSEARSTSDPRVRRGKLPNVVNIKANSRRTPRRRDARRGTHIAAEAASPRPAAPCPALPGRECEMLLLFCHVLCVSRSSGFLAAEPCRVTLQNGPAATSRIPNAPFHAFSPLPLPLLGDVGALTSRAHGLAPISSHFYSPFLPTLPPTSFAFACFASNFAGN